MNKDKIVNKKEVTIDIESLLSIKSDDTTKGYYVGSEDADNTYAIFIEYNGKRYNHNVAKLGTPGRGKNFRIDKNVK